MRSDFQKKRLAVMSALLLSGLWLGLLSTTDIALSQQPAPVKPDGTQKPGPTSPSAKPDFSPEKLANSLLDKLKQADDAETASALGDAVMKLWAHSGSPTVDLLMSQVAKAMSAKKYKQALGMLDAIVEIAPKFAEGWNRRATVHYLDDSFTASMADIHKVLELQPRHFGALSGLGLVMQALGDKKSALRAFRRALEVHPFMKGPTRAVKQLTPEVEGRGI